jgi:hypothetical protein
VDLLNVNQVDSLCHLILSAMARTLRRRKVLLDARRAMEVMIVVPIEVGDRRADGGDLASATRDLASGGNKGNNGIA